MFLLGQITTNILTTYIVLISILDITQLIKQVNFRSNNRTVVGFHKLDLVTMVKVD
jgi:hypothetical protein